MCVSLLVAAGLRIGCFVESGRLSGVFGRLVVGCGSLEVEHWRVAPGVVTAGID
jgi:hypothetical protein